MVEIIPSLPAHDYDELRTKMEKVRGLVPGFQIDICDGEFVPSVSWPMHAADHPQFEKIIRGEEQLPGTDVMPFEIHFMAHEPEKLIPDWLRAGASRCIFHVESRHDFAAIREVATGKELGISLLIDTPLERIGPYLRHISVIQLMSIATIGVQGQPFDARVLDRIRETKKRYPDATIEIDGAVNAETAPLLVEAGATRLAPGSYVLKNDDPKSAIALLQNL